LSDQFKRQDQVSISSKFYKQIFFTKVLCAAFLVLQFGFVIFLQKNIGTKTARKMLVKLITEWSTKTTTTSTTTTFTTTTTKSSSHTTTATRSSVPSAANQGKYQTICLSYFNNNNKLIKVLSNYKLLKY